MPPPGFGLCGETTFRQKPSARERAKCSAWAKCLDTGRLQSSPTIHKSYKVEQDSSAVRRDLLHHDLHQIPRLQPILLAQAVEYAKPLGRAVGRRHALGKLLDRVAALDLDHLEPERLRRGDLGGGHAAERGQ